MNKTGAIPYVYNEHGVIGFAPEGVIGISCFIDLDFL